jgi:hypothetical protein
MKPPRDRLDFPEFAKILPAAAAIQPANIRQRRRKSQRNAAAPIF